MANNYSDSSDENDLYPYNTNVKSLQGYNYEPRKKGNITVGPTQNKGVSRNECNERTGKKSERLGTVFWCKCSQCIVLRPPNTEKDCICCFDMKMLDKFGKRTECFIHNSEFADVCLNASVLKNVLICLNTIRMDNWPLNPPTNRQDNFNSFHKQRSIASFTVITIHLHVPITGCACTGGGKLKT